MHDILYNKKNREEPVLLDQALARSQVYYLATEYSVINMEGKSTWERAEDLISIAHPSFRDELVREAEKRKIWRKSSKRGY